MGMIQAGFKRAEIAETQALFAAVSGHDNSGKTHFGLSAPGEIALFNLDRGLRGVIEKFLAEGKVIWQFDVGIPKPKTDNVVVEKDNKKFVKNVQVVDKDVMEQAQDALNKVIHMSRQAMLDDDIRTLLYDTGTALWELWRIARFGKILQVPASAYPPVNAEFLGFCNELKESGKNVVMTHQMRPVYIDDKKTNRFEPAQFSKMDYISDISVRTEYGEDDDGDDVFTLMLTRCKSHPELQWDEFVSCDFATLASMVVDGTDAEDWE